MTYQLTIEPLGQTIDIEACQTVLDACLRAGVWLPHACGHGLCGTCKVQTLQGELDHGEASPFALMDFEREEAKCLACCATPLSDLEIEFELAVAPRAAPQQHRAVVERMDRLAPEVMRLVLALPDEGALPFVAGQYIHIVLPDGERRAFSFANPPHDNRRIELHVRHIPGGRFTGHVFTQMRVGDELRFEGPLGDFRLSDSDAPILMVAGATGFAPIKSIVEDAFHRGIARPMWLYWGVRRRADLYMLELAQRWQAEHPNFHVVPVLSEAAPEDAWTGRRGLVHEAMLADFPDLRGHEVYVCGSVKMVDAAVPAFVAQGVSEDACFSDAFLPVLRGHAVPAA